MVTSKARSKIKDTLKEDKKKLAEQGKEIILRKLKQLRVEPTHLMMEHMREYFNAPTHFDLYYRVGKGFITTADIKRFTEYKPSSPLRTKPNISVADAKTIEREITKIKTATKIYC